MNTDFNRLHLSHRWSAQELADAVPRRLSELITPELMRFGGDTAANGTASSPWAPDWRRTDRNQALFRVR